MTAVMWANLAALVLLLTAFLAPLALWRRPGAARLAGALLTLAGCAVGVAASVTALVLGQGGTITSLWRTPLGPLTLALDGLSAFFLMCVHLVGGLGALFGFGYVARLRGHLGSPAVAAWVPLLIAAMAVVVLAGDVLTFLLAWELMTLASFFLVTAEGQASGRPGLVYLLASQLGVAALFVLFLILAAHGDGTGFDAIRAASAPGAATAAACFVLAVIGFGTKAGFWPLHVWLPEAHPAAPSHVSAIMSGVMIKMGIYGLLRVLTFLGTPPAWWGLFLLGIGAVSGVGGVLHALAQHDLKRLLAYHSVENLGIIALGLGLGLLGMSQGNGPVAALGFAGALLHVLNHGLFKGLLFQGAGAVFAATGTRDFDELGGLARRMPVTGTSFLAGSAAITGLPPFNGFVSEFLIFLGAFAGATTLPPSLRLWALAVLPILALIGGLAAACFVKAFGITFLGEPRSTRAAQARESGRAMPVAMAVGALACLGIGLWPLPIVHLATRATDVLGVSGTLPPQALAALALVPWIAAALIGSILALALIRRALLAGRDVRRTATWGCGYEAPTPRMQYTAPSFADPVLTPAHFLLDAHHDDVAAQGPFPVRAVHRHHLGDRAADRFWRPLVRATIRLFERIARLERGDVPSYLVYVLLTLVALLLWQGGIP